MLSRPCLVGASGAEDSGVSGLRLRRHAVLGLWVDHLCADAWRSLLGRWDPGGLCVSPSFGFPFDGPPQHARRLPRPVIPNVDR